MKRLLALIIVSLTVASSAFAESSDYVFILKARNNPYWQAVVDGINETAQKRGLNAVVYQIANETAAEEQLNACMTALARHPKFLAISSVTSSSGLSCMKEAVKRGVAVADMDANILPDDAKKEGIDLAFSVGSDNFLIGQTAADYLAKVAVKRDPKILVLEGSVGSIPGDKRVGGFKETIVKLMPKAQITASVSADWDRLKAMNTTLDFLQRDPNLDVIYTANDQMALGAVEALRTAGKGRSITVIGIDGTSDARKAILAGDMTATVAQLPYYIGMRAVQKAMEVTTGRQTERVESTPTPVFDQVMLKAQKDPLLKYVR